MSTTITSWTNQEKTFFLGTSGYRQESVIFTGDWPDFCDIVAPIMFHALAHQWREQKGPISSVSRKVLLRPYQRIIGLGAPAIPLLLRELQQKPDHWFWALECITGENPVQKEDEGNIASMANAWIQWGQARGYL